MANYPTDGYRTTGARELSMPSRRNSGNAAPQPRVATRPRYNPTGDLRNVTIIPPNNTPATTTPPSGVGKTIHISPGQLQTAIDNSRIRNAPNAGNGLTIELTEKEYRDVQRGKTRAILRGILRALGRNPLFRDLRLRLALHVLELVVDIITNIIPVSVVGPYIQLAEGWRHWSYSNSWAGGPDIIPAPNQVPVALMEQVYEGPNSEPMPVGTIARVGALTPPTNAGWENAPHISNLTNQSASPTTTASNYYGVWQVSHHFFEVQDRWRHITTFRRETGSEPFSWSLMNTTTWNKVGPHKSAMPTGVAAPRTGVQGNGGYHAPGTPTKTKQPDLPQLPPVRVRERKLTATGAAARLWFGIGTVTEAADFINAIWNALPNSVKYRAFVQNGKRKLDPYERAVVIFNNLDKVNLPRAILNVVENQIEDMLYGKVGKGLGLATQVVAPSRPIGLGAGGWTKGFQYTGD